MERRQNVMYWRYVNCLICHWHIHLGRSCGLCSKRDSKPSTGPQAVHMLGEGSLNESSRDKGSPRHLGTRSSSVCGKRWELELTFAFDPPQFREHLMSLESCRPCVNGISPPVAVRLWVWRGAWWAEEDTSAPRDSPAHLPTLGGNASFWQSLLIFKDQKSPRF